MGEAWSDWYAIDFTTTTAGSPTRRHGDASRSGTQRGTTSSSAHPRPTARWEWLRPTARWRGSVPARAATRTPTSARSSAGPRCTPTARSGCRPSGRCASSSDRAVSESIVTRGMELSPPSRRSWTCGTRSCRRTRWSSPASHQDALWTLFAERGMGYYAAAADGSDVHPVADFDAPPDCAVDPCGTISGTIADSVSGAPLEGVHVGIAGHMSGLGNDLDDETDAAGAFSIAAVPFHAYEFVVDQLGYEPRDHLGPGGERRRDGRPAASPGTGRRSKGAPRSGTSHRRTTRTSAVARRARSTTSLGTGWGSDSPGPRKVVIKLPKAVDVTSFGFDPGNTCGDGPDAATKTFAIYTKKAGGRWVLAYSGGRLKTGRLNKLIPSAGSEQRAVREARAPHEPREPVVHGRERTVGSRHVETIVGPALPIRRRRPRPPRQPRGGPDRRRPSGCTRPRRTPRREARTRLPRTWRAAGRPPRRIPDQRPRGSAGSRPSPLMPGRFTSIRTRSGARSAAIVTESSPVSASPTTSKPSVASTTMRAAIRNGSWSSTISTRTVMTSFRS